MLIDLSVKVDRNRTETSQFNERMVAHGHLGTHFDVMDKEFPLSFTRRKGIVFDVSHRLPRDIELDETSLAEIDNGMFVAFYTGYIERVGYGSKTYFAEHPQLSLQLIDTLLEKGISIIGIDFAGVRRGKEHTPTDQHCADHGVFVVENLCNLNKVLNGINEQRFVAHTYPMNFNGLTGLPCRVVAEL